MLQPQGHLHVVRCLGANQLCCEVCSVVVVNMFGETAAYSSCVGGHAAGIWRENERRHLSAAEQSFKKKYVIPFCTASALVA